MIQTIEFKGKDISITLPSKEDMLKEIDNHFTELEQALKDGETKYPLYERDSESTLESVHKEHESILKQVSRIYSGDLLSKGVNQLSVKKNGYFKKNSSTDLIVVESATDYFTDYTNAWNTFRIHLVANSEDLCRIEMDTKTYTY